MLWESGDVAAHEAGCAFRAEATQPCSEGLSRKDPSWQLHHESQEVQPPQHLQSQHQQSHHQQSHHQQIQHNQQPQGQQGAEQPLTRAQVDFKLVRLKERVLETALKGEAPPPELLAEVNRFHDTDIPVLKAIACKHISS